MEHEIKKNYLNEVEGDDFVGFYHSLQNVTSLTSFFFIIWGISCFIIYKLILKEEVEAEGSGDQPLPKKTLQYESRSLLTFFLVSVSATMALISLLLLPLTILANEIILDYPNFYYTKWLNTDIVQSLWEILFVLTNLCLYFFLPFAYFYSEALLPVILEAKLSHKVHDHSFLLTFTILKETLKSFIPWLVILVGIVVTLRSLIYPIDDLTEYASYNPLSYSLLSFVGSFIVFCIILF